MASDAQFANFICQQMSGAKDISARKMFGEFTIYCGDKIVAIVADNQLFVKPTAAGQAMLGQPAMSSPYPGAKPYFLIADVDDPEFLSDLITATARELPDPTPRIAKKVASKVTRQPSTKRSAKHK
jgi:TfoX/Sxy family transcriptional regulator of competence genes